MSLDATTVTFAGFGTPPIPESFALIIMFIMISLFVFYTAWTIQGEKKQEILREAADIAATYSGSKSGSVRTIVKRLDNLVEKYAYERND